MTKNKDKNYKNFNFIGLDGSVDQNLNQAIMDGVEIFKDNKPLRFSEVMNNGCVVSVPPSLVPFLEASGVYTSTQSNENKDVYKNKKDIKIMGSEINGRSK